MTLEAGSRGRSPVSKREQYLANAVECARMARGRRHRLEVEAKLVHCGQRRSHRPSRTGTLRCETHGRDDRRTAIQSRANAFPTASRAGCYPEGRKRGAEELATTTHNRWIRDHRKEGLYFI